MANIKIVSWNPQGFQKTGIRTKQKCDFLMKEYNHNQFDILTLQETHHQSEEALPQYIHDLKLSHHFYHTPANANDTYAGIVVLIEESWTVIEKKEIVPGRLLKVVVQKGKGKIYNIMSIYVPPRKSSPGNYEKRIEVLKEIEKAYDENKVNMIIGDYNLIDSIYDKPANVRVSYNKKLDTEWRNIRDRINIVDPFRQHYPELRVFSFESKDKRRRSRVDKIYIDQCESDNISKNIYSRTPFDDHKILEVHYESNKQKGNGLWKLNISVLKDEPYIKRIKEAIQRVETRMMEENNHAKKWDVLTMVIQTVSIQYTKNKAYQKRKVKEYLNRELDKYSNIPGEELDKAAVERIQNLEKQLYKIQLDEIDGYKVRTRIPDFEKNEPRIDFYSKMEKQKGGKDTIYSLKDENEIQRTDIEDLKEVSEKFYTKLYTEEETKKTLQDRILRKVDKKLDQPQREELDKPIEEEELRKAVHSQQKGKSPSGNGLPAEFYQTFWEEIKTLYTNMINYAKTHGFTEKQNTGLIKLIYKKGDNEVLANYRPITLINTDIKILTKVLANRLKDVLPHIIHYTQTCVNGRKIDTTLHTVRDLIQLAEEKNLEAAFIFLDQEKAFDRVNHEFLFKVMKAFNIGNEFINWVKILYQGAIAQVMINGHLTGKIKLKRGVRQGDPLSPLLYVLVIEILALQLRTNPDLIGFTIKGEKLISFHYADDTTIAITQNKCWKEVIKELRIYEAASGAKINQKKTVGLWAGKWKNRTDSPMDIAWTSDNVKALGIYLGNNKPEEQTLQEIYEKMKKAINFWKGFYFSKFGKARIVEIFISSRLWYAAKFVSIPEKYQKQFQVLVSDYMNYPNKTNHIAEKELIKLREDGGIKLIHINTKAIASRIKWLSEVITNWELAVNKEIIDTLIGQQKHGYYGLNVIYLSTGIIKRMKIKSTYYDEIIKAMAELEPAKKIEDIQGENVLYNNIFKDNKGGKVTWPYINTVQKRTYGELKIEHDKKENGENHDRRLARYYELIKVEPSTYNDFTLTILGTEGTEIIPMIKIEEKVIYISLIKQKFYRLHKSEIKWVDHFSPELLDFKEIWAALQNNIVSEKTRSCIWEQIHLSFFTTYWFNKISNEKNICPLCKETPQSMKHILLECALVKKLWEEIKGKIMLIVPEAVTQQEMVFGITKDTKKPQYKVRNWITYKLREIVSKQEKATYDKPHVNNEKQIKLKFNKEILKEMTYKYLLHKREGTLNRFHEWFGTARDLFQMKDEKIAIVSNLLEIS